MKFSCEKCGRSYVADEKVRGRAFKMKCKQCGNLIVVKPAAALDSLDGSGPVPLPAAAELAAPVFSQTEPEPQPPAADPFAFEMPAGADPFALPPDPFALPPDPFAAPPPDPFARASHDPALEPPAGATMSAPAPAFDPFAEAVEAPPAGGPTIPAGGSRLSDVEALFADLAEEMKQPSPAKETPRAAVPAPPQVEPPPPVLAPPRPEPVPVAAAEPAPAKASRRGVVVAGAVALAAVAGGAGWFLTRSDGANPAAARAVPGAGIASAPSAPKPPAAASAGAPVAPGRVERAAPAPAAAPPAAPSSAEADPEDLPEAALADRAAPERSQRKSGASTRERDRKRAESRPVAKAAAAKPAPKPATAPTPPPAQPQAAPEPAKSEVTMAQVEVGRRSTAPQPTPAAALHTAPAAPPLASNSDLPPLDDGMIEATVAKYESSFDACVAASRQSEPGLAISGRKVVVTMTVNPNGRALYPTLDDVELGATDLGRCLKRESGKMVFPAFGGEPIRARVPLTLR